MNRKKLIGALLLPLAFSSCSSNKIAIKAMPVPETMQVADSEGMSKGRMLFERGEFALAADAFRRAVRQDPNSADAYNGLAASYDQLGRYDLSRRYYELALAQAPEDGKVLRNFARSMLRQGNQLAARKLIAEAAALDASKAAKSVQAAQAAADEMPYEAGLGAVTVALAPESTSPAPSLFQRIAATILPSAAALESEVSVALDPPVRAGPRKEASTGKPARLHIMNAVGRKRQAARMRSYLADNGWLGASIGDSRSKLQRSRILFGAKDAEVARALASALPFKPRLQPSRGAPALFLMLGRDSLPFDNGLRAPKQS